MDVAEPTSTTATFADPYILAGLIAFFAVFGLALYMLRKGYDL